MSVPLCGMSCLIIRLDDYHIDGFSQVFCTVCVCLQLDVPAIPVVLARQLPVVRRWMVCGCPHCSNRALSYSDLCSRSLFWAFGLLVRSRLG